MQKIIYTSQNKIDWDAQSAFKLTNYYTDDENCMVFCYLKQYVENGNLKICTFCFDKEASGKNDLQLCFNLNPEKQRDFIAVDFGIDGISSVRKVSAENHTAAFMDETCDGISYRSFRSNDQQGFYWCGELTLSKEFIENHFYTVLEEKSIILLNLYKLFPGRNDYACLFPDPCNILAEKSEYMQEFVVLNY
ncbi:MAG: hypothetical protein E7488_08270 [Ruminococcaceae bacterium]|nr:hypothetical protein [Oscillospiraceae bacterium]